MAYFELFYFIWDNTNPGMVYRLDATEAKEMVQSGRGSLWDNSLGQKVETPEEWLIDESNIADKVGEVAPATNKVPKVRQETILELQAKYQEKFGKPAPTAYKNNKERIAKKLY